MFEQALSGNFTGILVARAASTQAARESTQQARSEAKPDLKITAEDVGTANGSQLPAVGDTVYSVRQSRAGQRQKNKPGTVQAVTQNEDGNASYTGKKLGASLSDCPIIAKMTSCQLEPRILRAALIGLGDFVLFVLCPIFARLGCLKQGVFANIRHFGSFRQVVHVKT